MCNKEKKDDLFQSEMTLDILAGLRVVALRPILILKNHSRPGIHLV